MNWINSTVLQTSWAETGWADVAFVVLVLLCSFVLLSYLSFLERQHTSDDAAKLVSSPVTRPRYTLVNQTERPYFGMPMPVLNQLSATVELLKEKDTMDLWRALGLTFIPARAGPEDEYSKYCFDSIRRHPRYLEVPNLDVFWIWGTTADNPNHPIFNAIDRATLKHPIPILLQHQHIEDRARLVNAYDLRFSASEYKGFAVVSFAEDPSPADAVRVPEEVPTPYMSNKTVPSAKVGMEEDEEDEKKATSGKADVKRRKNKSTLPTATRITKLYTCARIRSLRDTEGRVYVPAMTECATREEKLLVHRILEEPQYVGLNAEVYWVVVLDMGGQAAVSLNPEIDAKTPLEVYWSTHGGSRVGGFKCYVYGNGASEVRGRKNSTYAVLTVE